MPLSPQMRENRALFNLSRARANGRGPLTLHQLYCASVNNATIARLEDAGAIVGTQHIEPPLFEITDAGERELDARPWPETIG